MFGRIRKSLTSLAAMALAFAAPGTSQAEAHVARHTLPMIAGTVALKGRRGAGISMAAQKRASKKARNAKRRK
jgi:hypothetical protein